MNRQINPNSLANLKQGGSTGRKPMPIEFKQIVENYSVKALYKVIEIIESEDTKTRDKLKAIEIILDRSLGRPTQAISLDSQIQLPTIIIRK